MSIIEKLKILRQSYTKNVIFSYLNINSGRNKLNDLDKIVGCNIDVLCIDETKIDTSFPEGEFILKGYQKLYRLDRLASSGGRLVYINSNIASRPFKFHLTA